MIETARLGRGVVQAAAFSPDGRLLVVAASTGITIYDAQTLAELNFEDTGAWVGGLAFSPDGQVIAAAEQSSARDSHQIRLWQLTTTSGQVTLAPLRTLPGLSYTHTLAFSPDGQYLAAADGV